MASEVIDFAVWRDFSDYSRLDARPGRVGSGSTVLPSLAVFKGRAGGGHALLKRADFSGR